MLFVLGSESVDGSDYAGHTTLTILCRFTHFLGRKIDVHAYSRFEFQQFYPNLISSILIEIEEVKNAFDKNIASIQTINSEDVNKRISSSARMKTIMCIVARVHAFDLCSISITSLTQ